MKKMTTIAAIVLAVLAGLGLSCDDGEEEGVKPPAYVYVFGDQLVGYPGFARYYSKTGEQDVLDFNTFCLAGAVNPDNGDIYIHGWNNLIRFNKSGKKLFDVWAMTERYTGREYVGIHRQRKTVYYCKGTGDIDFYDLETGEITGGANTPYEDPQQFIVDEVNNLIWLLAKGGGPLVAYTLDGALNTTITGRPIIAFALEPTTKTAMAIVNNGSTNILVRYSKAGTILKEIPLNFAPTIVGIEPGSGVIWVSDGYKSQRYSRGGGFLTECPGFGFSMMAFSYDGKTVFGVNAAGVLYAADTVGLSPIWERQYFGGSWFPQDVAFYSPKAVR